MEIYIDEYIDPVSRRVGIALLNHVIESIENFGRIHTIRYDALCKKVGYIVGPRQIGNYLGEISDLCLDNGLPPISAIVVNKNNFPGQGFFDYFYPEVGTSFDGQVMVLNKVFPEIESHGKEWREMLEVLEDI